MEISDQYFQSDLLSLVVQARAEKGDFYEAADWARNLPSFYMKITVLADLADVAAHGSASIDIAKQLRSEAHQLLDQLDDGLYKVRALSRLGCFLDAKKTLSKIGKLDERVMAEVELLKALAAKNRLVSQKFANHAM